MALGGKYDWGRGEDHCAEHTLLMGAGGDIGTESGFFFLSIQFNSIVSPIFNREGPLCGAHIVNGGQTRASNKLSYWPGKKFQLLSQMQFFEKHLKILTASEFAGPNQRFHSAPRLDGCAARDLSVQCGGQNYPKMIFDDAESERQLISQTIVVI